MKSKSAIAILCIICLIFSCKKNKTTTRTKTAIDSTYKIIIDTVNQQPEAHISDDSGDTEFPAIGKSVEDFIPKNYETDLETEGDLNLDGLTDKVIILIKTKDSTAQRTAIVLLKQKNNSYALDAKSIGIVEPKYREDGFLNYDYEDIKIEKNGQLVITQQALGPLGNIESIYKYVGNDLVLSHISTFNMGAGGQIELNLDLIKGIAEQTDIDTMDENMPSETHRKPYKPRKILFENSDPRAIINETFR
ncbi:hypothetical protein LUD75_14285 [Epilithonimonas sp. JDS]|uniref:hypothetical protein n=1 Tax=Epilithonimonas sp. JDS TaxID=2902797 RepID=UPI001E60D322|nr:hypothetical protein [Epilithonimonas sp. JDS]MCD9855890.1 hypothetical protein [Epilithonimonas sp. JDS]